MVKTKAKFHITVGHETVMGHVSFFSLQASFAQATAALSTEDQNFDFSLEYSHQDELFPDSSLFGKSPAKDEGSKEDSLPAGDRPVRQFVLIELEKPVTCPVHALMIGSKLDTDIHANFCRLAFHGKIMEVSPDPKYRESFLPKLKVSKN